MTYRNTDRRFSVVICTIVFSATCVLGAVGPALTGSAPTGEPGRIAIETPAARLLA